MTWVRAHKFKNKKIARQHSSRYFVTDYLDCFYQMEDALVSSGMATALK